MDLREKPGKLQTFLELSLRFRLIALVVMVVATVSIIASNWMNIVSLPLGASESFGMWLAETENIAVAWQSAHYIIVATIACIVMFIVFSGIKATIAVLISAFALIGALYAMGGSETMPLPMFAAFTIVALIFLLFVKCSIACGLFTFALSWVFLSGLISVTPEGATQSWFTWGALSTLGFASSMAFCISAGNFLNKGMPHTGALVKAASQIKIPVIVGALLVISATEFDTNQINISVILHALLHFAIFVIWFYAFFFPITSFAPWERLRSNSRRIEMKKKKK